MHLEGIPDGIRATDPSEVNRKQVESTSKPSESYADATRKAAASTGGRDSAQISVDAAELSRYQEMVRLHREAFGEAQRTQKLDAVRQRIQSGYYDSPEALDNMAERVLESTVADAGPAGNLDTVRRRSAEGYYDQPQVVDKTAGNMLRSVLPGSQEDI